MNAFPLGLIINQDAFEVIAIKLYESPLAVGFALPKGALEVGAVGEVEFAFSVGFVILGNSISTVH